MKWTRWVGAMAAMALMAGIVAACGDDGAEESSPSDSSVDAETGRELSADEAQSLALVRFRNFDMGTREVSFEVGEGSENYSVEGWVEFDRDTGYGLLTRAGDSQKALIVWTELGVAQLPWEGDQAPLPPPGTDGEALPDGATWGSESLDPTASRLHAVLALTLTLSADRPENSLLLQQSDARWLRSESLEVAGESVEVSVMSAPTRDLVEGQEVPTSETVAPTTSGEATGSSALRLWVADDGTMHRAEVQLGGAGTWTTIDLGDAVDVDFAEALEAAGG